MPARITTGISPESDSSHASGSLPLRQLPAVLGERITEAFGPDRPIDLMGILMGAVIGRAGIQVQEGYRRTRGFTSVARPHPGP